VASGGSTLAGGLYLAATPEQFGYDADGNLTNDGRWAYTWDAENRLASMAVNTNVGPQYQLTFAYDAQGRRIQKTVTTNGTSFTTLNFVYDGWNPIAILNSQSAIVTAFTWGSDLSGSIQGAGGVGGLVSLSYRGTTTTNCFAAFDGNGNLAALVNAGDGTLVASYEYGPFGEVVRTTGPMGRVNPVRFSTKYQDDESDLLYYGYRYYKSSTGTWVSRDPLTELGFSLLVTGEQTSLGDDDDSPNLNDFLTAGGPNIYDFIQNNGVNFADHLGLFLAAIDGTDSKLWVGQKLRNSFVKNFYNSYVAAGGNAKYWDGPKTLGGGVARTVTAVYNAICAAKAANPSEQIDLVGHSRGGLIAILVAKRLQEHPCGSCGINEFVRFMGLYDAVGMYLWASPGTISRNVVYVAHARRDPADGSRPNWGNVGTSGGMTYVQQFFWCTHSGMGGDPWGGDTLRK
jgi:RHS repeat-associated protein